MSRRPVFLKRHVYRQRRMRDAARLLPVAGGFLLLLPLLWPAEGQGGDTSSVGIYLFAVWLGLVLMAAALAPALVTDPAPDAEDPSVPTRQEAADDSV